MSVREEGTAAHPERMRIHVYPAEVLRRAAQPVLKARSAEPNSGEAWFDERLEELARRMIRTMYAEEGVGLAAPHVGESVRMVVIGPPQGGDSPGNSPIVLVNPVIVDASGRDIMEEGCLSVPGVRAKVRRRERVTVEYETLAAEKKGFEAEGLAARVIQHEIDHLDGTLFVDRLGPAGKFAVRKLLRELDEKAEASGRRRRPD